MNAVKNALTRKFGPLPAWTWAIIVGVALYFIRNRAGAGGAGTDTSGAAGTLPYFGAYGENYYPLSGGGGVTGGGSGGGDTGTGSGNGGSGGGGTGGSPQPNPVINVNVTNPGDGNKGQPGTGTHPKRVPKPKRPKGAPKGSEHTGPKSPGKGWRGIGGGWWAPPKHKKPRGGAGKAATGRNRGSVTVGSDRVSKPRPTGGGGLTKTTRHAPVRQTSAPKPGPKAGTGKRRK